MSGKHSSGVVAMKWKKHHKAFASVAAAALVGLLASSASGDGLVAGPRDLSLAERTVLTRQIDELRAADPAICEAVANVQGHRPEFYKDLRNPVPMVGRELRRLGPDALLPMLDALVFDAPPTDGATLAEQNALKIGLLDAVGRLRDARAESALAAAFHNTTGDVAVAAAEAVGRSCTDHALGVLETGLGGANRSAAIAGLGQCRRVEAAEALSAALDATGDPGEAELIAKALGRVASSWAWQAMGSQHQAAGLKVRAIATRALLRSFSRFGGEARQASIRGLSAAAHPDLRTLVSEQGVTGTEIDRTIKTIEKRAR